VKLNFPDGFREALQYFIEWIAKSQSWLLFICLFKECMQTMKDKCPPPHAFWNIVKCNRRLSGLRAHLDIFGMRKILDAARG